MRVVVDTNVVISGTFFGGAPRRIVEAVSRKDLIAAVTPEIADEYLEIVNEMIERKQGTFRTDAFSSFVSTLEFVKARTHVKASRDPDDDKFIGCAIDAKALWIVSGDKDLLTLEHYGEIEILTAAEFCARYLD